MARLFRTYTEPSTSHSTETGTRHAYAEKDPLMIVVTPNEQHTVHTSSHPTILGDATNLLSIGSLRD